MAKKKRSWLAKHFGRRPVERRRQLDHLSRRLAFESLENRQMLSLPPSLVALIADSTPNPQVSGDQPQSPAQSVPLANYTAETLVDPGIPDLEPFFTAMDAIFAGIASNSAARPAVWTENVADAPNQVRMHFDDNGMLTREFDVAWGDGSATQIVPGAVLWNGSPNPSATAWVIHQYPATGQYTINVTAQTMDGTYSAATTDSFTDGVGIGGGDSGLQVNLPAVPPTLHVAGPQTVAAGQTFALDNLVSLSDPDAQPDAPNPFTTDYSYTVDWGDGSQPFTGSNVQVISPGGNGLPFLGALSSASGDGPLTHVYTDPGTFNLAVTVTQISSGLSDTQTIPITVEAQTPTITVGGYPITEYSCNEGTAPITFGATVSPTPTDSIAYNWQIVDSEGDTVFQSTDPSPSYTFSSPDTYTVSLTTSVDNVTSASATATIAVANVAPSFVQSSPLATVTASVAQTVTLPFVSFTDLNPADTHTATVTWDNSNPTTTTDDATVTEESSDGATPGTITDSYTYTTAGTYYGAVTLTDSEGLWTSLAFSFNVVSAEVAFTDFTPSSDGSQLQVSYTVTGGTAAPFTIGIYTSPDGVTPDQLLQSVTVDGSSSSLPLGPGYDIASFTPQFDDVQSNYHLIAVSDTSSDATQSTVEFAGGVFYAESVTASPPQNILYVFGAPYERTGTQPTDTVTIDNESGTNHVYFSTNATGSLVTTDYTVDSSVAAIHVRAEGGDDTITGTPTFPAVSDTPGGATAATIPLWIFGGDGTNTLAGGDASNFILGGNGTNTIHGSNGVSTPQTIDDTDTTTSFPDLRNSFSDSGSWSSQTVAAAFNGEELSDATTSGTPTDSATWTFANLEPTGYYDVYVTWSPLAGAAGAAQYSVYDGATLLSNSPTVNQGQAPVDYQAAGVDWHDLGVFQATSAALIVQLGNESSESGSIVLASAAMIIPESTPPLTTLSVGSFSVDSQGNLSVTYTINGEDAPPFSIGIYGSPDGIQPTNLLQSYEVDDPSLLTGGGASHTVTFPASLDELDSCQYVIAELDSSNAVQEASRADNISSALSGIFEQSDGALLVVGNSSSLTADSISLTQDINGNVTVNVADSSGDPISSQTFSGVTSASFSTPGGDNSVNVDPSVSVPVSAWDGPGSSLAGPVAATDEIPSITIVSFPATIGKGATAGLIVNVGNLGGRGFSVTVNWGLYEGSDTVVYPAGTTLFSMNHHYVDDGYEPFATEFPVTIDVTPSEGQTATFNTSTLGVDVPLIVGIECLAEGISAHNPIDATVMVSDPGEFGSFYYYWTATGGGETFTGTAASFSFTPSYQTSYTLTVAVTNGDGDTFDQSETIPGTDVSGGSGGITPFVPDEPTVSIQECDADRTPDDSSIAAGADAYFLVWVPEGTDEMPNKGTVSVWYNTADGPALDYGLGPIAHANTDYFATEGELTFSYDPCADGGEGGYDSQIISVETVATTPNGGTFTVQIPCFSDPFASTVGSTLGVLVANATASIVTTEYQLWADNTNVTNNSADPDSVRIGQLITFGVRGAPENATITWNLPAFPSQMIGSFVSSTPGGPEPPKITSPPFQPAQNNTCEGIWVQGNGEIQSLYVEVSVPGLAPVRITGYFDPTAPFAEATLTPYSRGLLGTGVVVLPDNTPNVSPLQSAVTLGDVPFHSPTPPADPTDFGVMWQETGVNDPWRFMWVQTLSRVVEVKTGLGNVQELHIPAGALDSLTEGKNPWGDRPGQTILLGQSLFFQIYATVWLMVEVTPNSWVPVSSIDWNWTVFATYPDVPGTFVNIISTSRSPVNPTLFTPTSEFPSWTVNAGDLADQTDPNKNERFYLVPNSPFGDLPTF